MHKNTKDLKGQRFGNLTVLNLTDLRLPGHRCAVWECKCDCGKICYKTGTDLKDKRRKTVSCGCKSRARRTFPEKFVPKEEKTLQTSITKLSSTYGITDLLTAAIMRNNGFEYESAKEVAKRIISSGDTLTQFIKEYAKDEPR